MPRKINSWLDEVNGGLVWALTAATAQKLVLGVGPFRFKKRAPISGSGADGVKWVSVWPSEPAVTHFLTEDGRAHIRTATRVTRYNEESNKTWEVR